MLHSVQHAFKIQEQKKPLHHVKKQQTSKQASKQSKAKQNKQKRIHNTLLTHSHFCYFSFGVKYHADRVTFRFLCTTQEFSQVHQINDDLITNMCEL